MESALEDSKKKVLITGIAGPRGRRLAERLAATMDVCGVDVLRWRGPEIGVRVHRVDLRKRKFEDVVRTERPDVVVHMGFVRHFEQGERIRHDVNVRGATGRCSTHGRDEKGVSGAVYAPRRSSPSLLLHVAEDSAPIARSFARSRTVGIARRNSCRRDITQVWMDACTDQRRRVVDRTTFTPPTDAGGVKSFSSLFVADF